jgi:hypothetical protein
MGATKHRGAWGIVALLLLAPAAVRGQDTYSPPSWTLPFPTGSTRPEEGGLFVNTSFAGYQISNPLKNQTIARRGFRIYDTSLGTAPGAFIGPGTDAINSQQLRDDRSWQPGFTFNVGYKFQDGSALELNWFFLSSANYSYGATPDIRDGKVNEDFANTFLTAFVYNEPLEFSGPPGKVNGASDFGVFGLFNGATIMTQKFQQRFQQWELVYRWVVHETEDTRISGIIGPRYAWFWEKYQLRSVNFTADGGGGGLSDTGLYSAISSNRMYGVTAGAQCEQYLGHGFACIYEGRASTFLNSVKQRGKFETANKYGGDPSSKFARREFTLVPELQGSIGLMWFPTETIQLEFKYEGMVFFNTLATQRPMAFDYLKPRPDWQSTIRWLHGFQVAVGTHF